jgi:hypothetical protein
MAVFSSMLGWTLTSAKMSENRGIGYLADAWGEWHTFCDHQIENLIYILTVLNLCMKTPRLC